MKSFTTVKAKLRIVFALFFAMICALALYGNNNLKELKDDINHISVDITPQLRLLQDIDGDVVQFRVEEASHVLSTDSQTKDTHEAQMKKYAAEIDDWIKKFLNSDISSKEKKHVNEFIDVWNQYLTINKQLLPVSRQYDSPAHAEFLAQAAELFNKQGESVYLKSDKLLNALVDGMSEESDAASDDANNFVGISIRNGTIAMGIAAIISILMVVMFERTVLRYLIRITLSMKRLSGGDNTVVIEGTKRSDEIGEMAKSLEVFKENALQKERMEQEQKQMEINAEIEKKTMMHKLAGDFESGIQGIITTVSSAATELYQTAEDMQKTVANVSTQSGTAAAASEQTSGNVQSVSAAVEEMSASVREIASQISKSTVLVNATVKQTEQADKTTQALSDAVVQISGILDLIQNIAGQINLLALNATIESARAGDAGKGFAVVASEVKNLAGQTTKATEEIAKQIGNVQHAAQEVVGVLSAINDAIGNVNQYSSGIASAVEEQATATQEIASNMQHASQGVQNITSNISEITKGASNANHAANEVLSASQMLSQQSEMLNQQVKLFLDGVRAA